jgi:hypothetical protein
VAGPGKVHVQPVFDAEVTAVTEELCGLSSRLRRGRHLLMTIRINRSSRCGSRDLRGVRLVVSDDHSRLRKPSPKYRWNVRGSAAYVHPCAMRSIICPRIGGTSARPPEFP